MSIGEIQQRSKEAPSLAALNMLQLQLLALTLPGCLAIYSPASEPLLRKISLGEFHRASCQVLSSTWRKLPLMTPPGRTALPCSSKPLPFITGPEHPEALTQHLWEQYFVFLQEPVLLSRRKAKHFRLLQGASHDL